MISWRLIYRVPLALGALVVFIVLSLAADAAELRKKQKLGAAYEGPLTDCED